MSRRQTILLLALALLAGCLVAGLGFAVVLLWLVPIVGCLYAAWNGLGADQIDRARRWVADRRRSRAHALTPALWVPSPRFFAPCRGVMAFGLACRPPPLHAAF